MLGEDYIEFAKWLSGIGEIYKDNYSPLLIEIYWQALRKYNWNVIKSALTRIIEYKIDNMFISLSDIKTQIKIDYNYNKLSGKTI